MRVCIVCACVSYHILVQKVEDSSTQRELIVRTVEVVLEPLAKREVECICLDCKQLNAVCTTHLSAKLIRPPHTPFHYFS